VLRVASAPFREELTKANLGELTLTLLPRCKKINITNVVIAKDAPPDPHVDKSVGLVHNSDGIS
jgi:hypothetical protein